MCSEGSEGENVIFMDKMVIDDKEKEDAEQVVKRCL